MSVPKPIVFLGPSLRRDDAQALLDAEYRPPAAQGDVMRACQTKPCAIAIIDGVFKDQPTVRHREILWAMAQGIPVFGAASMGALRASELSSQGMIGIGLIFRWYRRFALLPDDAVAVTHGPAELGSPPLSDALIDIRRALRRTERAGRLSSQKAKDLLAKVTHQPFADRRMPDICAATAESQKAADARALLRCLANQSAVGDWPSPVAREPAVIHAWLDDLRDSGLTLNDPEK